MGRRESAHCVPLLVPVVDDGADEVVKVDVAASVMVLVDVGSEDIVDVVLVDGTTVVQLGPEQVETLMSAQFQNFSAPLLLVRGSTTAAGHEDNVGFHHALASPPNLSAIHDCVELLLKYS